MVEKKRSEICYILSYRSPDYTRTGALVAALKSISDIELIEARNTRTGLMRYSETIWRLFRIRLKRSPSAYILGFRGHEIFWIVRLLTKGKPLVIDAMMSPYDSLTRERKIIPLGGLLDRMIYRYEKSALEAADLILTDTNLHRDYFTQLFSLPAGKICPVCMGADEELFHPREEGAKDADGLFRVLFYGSFLPLHGMDVILRAAVALKDEPVRFEIIGGTGKNLQEFRDTIRHLGLANVRHRTWVAYEDLPYDIGRADLCLAGPFGGTGQGQRIVTGKAYQCLAMAKPVVIGAIPEDQGFRDRQNCLIVPQGSAEDLAEAIRWSLGHPEALQAIGREGRRLYEARFSRTCLQAVLEEIFQRPLFTSPAKEDS